MRTNKPKKIFVNDSDKLLELMTNPSYEMNNFYELSDDALLLSYNMRAECDQIQSYVNVVLAAYTSALARIHLYKYLDMLQERCLYHDTDSVIFSPVYLSVDMRNPEFKHPKKRPVLTRKRLVEVITLTFSQMD